jgi:hypothetical protein
MYSVIVKVSSLTMYYVPFCCDSALILVTRREHVLSFLCLFLWTSVAQPFYTRGTLNIVEESWRHNRGGDGCVTFQFHLVDLVCPTIIKKIKIETEQKTR